MIRTLILSVAVFGLCTPAFAEPDTPKPQDPRIAEILANMPSEAEIDTLMSDMPDMSRLMTGMMDIATDEDNHAALERVGKRLETRFENMDLETTLADGEMPDINALIREMMIIGTDKEMMGDLLGLAFQVSDVMEEVVEEAEADAEGK